MITEETLIYETKLNSLWADGSCAYLKHKNGIIGKLDKDPKIIDAVIESIESNGNFHYSTPSTGFVARDKRGGLKHSLLHLIYSAHTAIPIEEINRRKQFKFKNGDKLDFRIENLFYNRNRLSIHGKYMCMFDEYGNYSLTDYHEDLANILKSRNWAYNPQNKTFMAYCGNKSGNSSIYQVCYCFLHRNATVDTLDEVLWSFKRECKAFEQRRDHLTIDHKSSIRQDNRNENLQLISHWLNAKKRNHTARLQSNQFYIPVVGGEIAGRRIYKTDVFGNLFNAAFGIRPFDVQLLNDVPGTERAITNLVNMVKNDTIPDNALALKTSWLMYVAALWLAYMVVKNGNPARS
ncbi:MAG: hypothetical protein FWG31_03600 [Oscillospiraceae bacterium]|nr:hypothetical protein [Oscillospiraceae bacterium]